MTKELKVKCPKCKKEVGTGIAVDKSSFENNSFSNNSTDCNNCGKVITWSKNDVVNM